MDHYLNTDDTCLAKPICALGEFADGLNCTSCHENCTECFGPEATQCIKCLDQYLLSEDSCLTLKTNCQHGYFATFENQCENCAEKCMTCTAKEECIQCVEGFAFGN